jgi:hypothetical protein
MSEIKSTLELILEKTKGLTATEDEKKAFHREETEKRVRGLVQKCLDGFMGVEEVKQEISGLGKDQQAWARESLVRICAERMDPDADNTLLFKVIEDVAGRDSRGFRQLINAYGSEAAQERRRAEAAFGKELEQRGIRGSAVIPNANADARWMQWLKSRKEKFQRDLMALAE